MRTSGWLKLARWTVCQLLLSHVLVNTIFEVSSFHFTQTHWLRFVFLLCSVWRVGARNKSFSESICKSIDLDWTVLRTHNFLPDDTASESKQTDNEVWFFPFLCSALFCFISYYVSGTWQTPLHHPSPANALRTAQSREVKIFYSGQYAILDRVEFMTAG